MSKVANMSMNDLLQKTGIACTETEFQVICNYNEEAIAGFIATEKAIEEAEREEAISQGNKMFGSNDKIKAMRQKKVKDGIWQNLFMEFENVIDKERLVLFSLYNRQKAIQDKSLDKEMEKSVRSEISDIIKIIGRDQFRVVFLGRETYESDLERVCVLDSQELIRMVKGNKKISSLYEAPKEKMKRMENVAEIIRPVNSLINGDDIIDIVATEHEVGEYMVLQLLENLKARIKGQDENDLQNIKTREKYIRQMLVNNAKYVDIDRLLLIIGYRIIETLEQQNTTIQGRNIESFSKTEQEAYFEYLQAVMQEILKEVSDKTKIEAELLEGEEKDYTLNSLKNDAKRLTGTRYVSKKELEEMRRALVEGEILIIDIPEDIRMILEVKTSDYDKMMLNRIENLIYLIEKFEENDVSEKDCYRLIGMLDKIPGNVLDAMKNRGILSFDRAVEYFEAGKITAEQVKNNIPEEEVDLNRINEKIRELYLEMKKVENDESKMQEYIETISSFSRYAGLYRQFNFEGKSEEEINSNSSNLIESFGDELLNNETLSELYQYGLISLDSSVDWGIDINEMLIMGKMKPTDVKRFYERGQISLEQIKEVLVSEDMSSEDKQDLIYSTFDGEEEEQEKLRNELIQLLRIDEEYREESKNTGKARARKSGIKRKEYVTDHFARWKFLSLVDKEYGKMLLPKGVTVNDGHRLFLLPSHGKVVIEKMYENRKGRMENCYGYATYIMNIEEFFKNIEGEEGIIAYDKINRGVLLGLSEAGKADKKIHGGNWGKSLMKYFGIDEKNERYSKEELEAIKKAADAVKESRREKEEAREF